MIHYCSSFLPVAGDGRTLWQGQCVCGWNTEIFAQLDNAVDDFVGHIYAATTGSNHVWSGPHVVGPPVDVRSKWRRFLGFDRPGSASRPSSPPTTQSITGRHYPSPDRRRYR